MNKEQLKIELSQADIDYERAKRDIYKKYAYANNPYKIGDIIKDHIGILKIEKIGFHISFGESCCIYNGIELKVNHEPIKKQTGRTVYQDNIIAEPINKQQ